MTLKPIVNVSSIWDSTIGLDKTKCAHFIVKKVWDGCNLWTYIFKFWRHLMYLRMNTVHIHVVCNGLTSFLHLSDRIKRKIILSFASHTHTECVQWLNYYLWRVHKTCLCTSVSIFEYIFFHFQFSAWKTVTNSIWYSTH